MARVNSSLSAMMFAALTLAASGALAEGRTGILHLVGDSTLFRRAESAREGSWGEALGRYLVRDRAIVNWSLCGKTVLTIEPSWTNAVKAIRQDDIVIFQFGINDAAPAKFVDEKTFKTRLGAFVDAVRSRGARPVLCSPLAALGYMKEDPLGSYAPSRDRRRYRDYVRDLAAAKQVDFVDMTRLTEARLQSLGREQALGYYVGDSTMNGEYWFDDTHPTKAAAVAYARMFVDEVRRRGLPVAAWFGREPKDETAHWQGEIDKAAANGGGRVIVPPGPHEVGQLNMRSGVELHLAEGAELLGLPCADRYAQLRLPCSEGDWGAVVFAHQVTNVAITGRGTIDARGGLWPHGGFRPRGLFFSDSARIRLEDFEFRDSASWGVVFKRCDGVSVRRLTVSNHMNDNNDGIDVEAKNVVIADSSFDGGDDAICVKSNDPEFTVENVLVTNCLASSHCNGLKLGTASHGTMRNVRFVDCRTACPRRNYVYREGPEKGRMAYWWRSGDEFPLGIGVGAINVECVDGGAVEDVLFENIDVYGFEVPIFIRGGVRRRRSTGVPPSRRRILRNITIRNVRGAACGALASTISGAAGCEPKNVRLENVDIVCRGCSADRRATCEPSALYDGFYPDADMFRFMKLPAYGLYVDRAEVALERVSFPLRPGDADVRPGIYRSTVESQKARARLGGYSLALELTDEVAGPGLRDTLRSKIWEVVYVAAVQRGDEPDGAFVARVCDLAETVREHAPQAAVFLRKRGSDAAYDRLAQTPYGFRVAHDEE